MKLFCKHKYFVFGDRTNTSTGKSYVSVMCEHCGKVIDFPYYFETYPERAKAEGKALIKWMKAGYGGLIKR